MRIITAIELGTIYQGELANKRIKEGVVTYDVPTPSLILNKLYFS